MRLPTIAAMLTALSGCTSDDAALPAAQLRHEVDSVGGVVTARSAGDAPIWALDTLLTVGSEAAMGEPAPDEFGLVTSVLPGPDGTLWLADALNAEIKVFDEGGELVRRIGRKGQGPGEFLSIYSLVWVGDRLLVLDLGNGRVAELSSEGAWMGSRPAPGRVTGSPATLRFYAVSDSVAYQWSLKTRDRSVEWVWIEHGPEGVRAEWPQQRPAPPQPTGVRCDLPNGSISFFEIPFGGAVLEHPAGGGNTYLAWSADYRIALVSPEGDTLRMIERVRAPVPITDVEWDSATAEFNSFRDESPGADCEPSSLERPSAKAALRSLLTDTSGRIWAEIFTESGTAWEVFDAQGLLQGRVGGFDYDPRVAPVMRGDRIAWVDRDTLGVQRAQLARIRDRKKE
jgi:6-bladed beta-propeller